jgi:hypothetical protein
MEKMLFVQQIHTSKSAWESERTTHVAEEVAMERQKRFLY